MIFIAAWKNRPRIFINAIDWASRPWGDNSWSGKPTAIMGATIGIGGTLRAQLQLRQMLVALDMLVINRPEVLISFAQDKFDASGTLTHHGTRAQIAELLGKLEAWTHRLTAAAEGAEL